MTQSLKPKTKQPSYEHTTEEQTMLYWRLQSQRNDRNIPGYMWNVRDALQGLNRITEDFRMPESLRSAAGKLNHEIIIAAKPKKPTNEVRIAQLSTIRN